MEINGIVREAHEVAALFGLESVEVDKTDNTISLKVVIDAEIAIHVYGNTQKDKLNLALIFKQRRLYGYDSAVTIQRAGNTTATPPKIPRRTKWSASGNQFVLSLRNH